jgi:hypothetical protein
VPKQEVRVWVVGEVEVRQGNYQSSSMLYSSRYVPDVCALNARQVLRVVEGQQLRVEVEAPGVWGLAVVPEEGISFAIEWGSGSRTPGPQPSAYSPIEPCLDLTLINSAISLPTRSTLRDHEHNIGGMTYYCN